jgi:hypothetical protein
MNTFRHDRTSMENPGTSNSAYLPKVFTHNGDNSVCSSATPTPEIDVTASKIIPSELCCMLCRRVLCDPSILKSCLHRFCALCIKRCFSTGQRKCPHCGKISSSADPVIFDPNFSLLTSKLSNSPKRMMTPNNDGINGDNHNGTVGSKRLKSDNISLPPSSCSSRTRSNQLNGISKLTKFSMTMNSTSYIGIGDAGRISLCRWFFFIGDSMITDHKNKHDLFANCFRSLTTWLQVILWPDGSVFRKTDMPRCLRRPRYVCFGISSLQNLIRLFLDLHSSRSNSCACFWILMETRFHRSKLAWASELSNWAMHSWRRTQWICIIFRSLTFPHLLNLIWFRQSGFIHPDHQKFPAFLFPVSQNFLIRAIRSQ